MALHSSIASVCVSTCRRAHTRESASYKLCTNSWIGFAAFPNATLVLSFKVNLIISISSMTCFHLLTCCNLLFLLKSILKFFIWHSLLFFSPLPFLLCGIFFPFSSSSLFPFLLYKFHKFHPVSQWGLLCPARGMYRLDIPQEGEEGKMMGCVRKMQKTLSHFFLF